MTTPENRIAEDVAGRMIAVRQGLEDGCSGQGLAMHELSIMAGTLELALEEAARLGAERIVALHLKVGVLAGVVPDALSFAFDVLAAGTPAEGATLDIERVALRASCAPCGIEFEPVDALCQCSRCGRPSDDIRAGQELQLASMEVQIAG